VEPSPVKITNFERIAARLKRILILTLAPIWLPHCPAWRWTISLILIREFQIGCGYREFCLNNAAMEALQSRKCARENGPFRRSTVVRRSVGEVCRSITLTSFGNQVNNNSCRMNCRALFYGASDFETAEESMRK
jgi:hypothetical protein